ncbi:MAG TPA: hypothetical protein EYH58_00195 [Aquifex aeolicus]|nr:hypothetical protein [Aquifex aeolicus]
MMLYADIFEKAYKLKVFQIWELTEELYKDWEGIFSKKVVKDRVTSFIASQLRANSLIKVRSDPSIFAFPEFGTEWEKYVRKRKCQTCGKEFIPFRPEQVYCSEKCRERRKASPLPPQKTQKKWAKEEEEFLKRELRKKGKLSKKDMVEIAQKLQRSYRSVWHKVRRLQHEAKNNP